MAEMKLDTEQTMKLEYIGLLRLRLCCANRWAIALHLVQSSHNILHPILNSWNATLVTFHFSEAMLHNSVPKFHTIPKNRTNPLKY